MSGSAMVTQGAVPAPAHEALRRGADDVKAEVAPEAFRGLEPALFPAQEGQLGGAPEGGRPGQSLDIGGQLAFGNRLGLPKNCGGAFHGGLALERVAVAEQERPVLLVRGGRGQLIIVTISSS
jgi:hypothetical protein